MTPNGFDKLARAYRWMEYLSFGLALQRCRTHFLPRMAGVGAALVLGDGDGRFTARLLATAIKTHVTAVDASPAMLAQLRSNCTGESDRLFTQQALLPSALQDIIKDQSFDLVATHFFLDCLTTIEVEELARTLRPHLAEDATWIISDFAIPRGFFHLPSAAIVATLYASFRMLTGLQTRRLPQHEHALAAGGFVRMERTTQLGGLLIAELWQTAPRNPDRIKIER